MLLKEKSFHGSSSYIEKHKKLCMEAGSASWFPEFKLVNLTFLPILHKLLFIFYQFQLCCVLSGKFVYHIAGLVKNIPHLSVFVVLNKSTLVEFIFRRYPDIGEIFYFQSFKFRLIDINYDICKYELTFDGDADFFMVTTFYGIDADSRCDYRSNVDFTHFIWQNFDRFSMCRHTITILPTDDDSPNPDASLSETKLLFLKYYRAASDGWRDNMECNECAVNNRHYYDLISNCVEPNCSCIICKRQPPSLRDICSSIYLRDEQHFELNVHTTFDEYVYAVNSNVHLTKLIPPEHPKIMVFFKLDQLGNRIHSHCPGESVWEGLLARIFDTPEHAVEALANVVQKNFFWCFFCGKGLFFPDTCLEHPEI